MIAFFEQIFAAILNRLRGRHRGAWHDEGGALTLGFLVVDSEVTKRRVTVSHTQRAMHMVIVGVSGSGKSFELLNFTGQDIEEDRGFLFLGPHGDMAPRLLRRINARERREHRHLSGKLVLVDPSDPVVSVGLNPLEQETPDFVHIADVAEIIRLRCGIDQFGVRIQETLTNTLFVLAAN